MTALRQEAYQLLNEFDESEMTTIITLLKFINFAQKKARTWKRVWKDSVSSNLFQEDCRSISMKRKSWQEGWRRSMVILVDTNIILDVITKREPFAAESQKILELCARQELKGYIAFHSVSNIFFILRKRFSNKERRLLLLGIL